MGTTPATIRCSECGSAIPADARFCDNCGAQASVGKSTVKADPLDTSGVVTTIGRDPENSVVLDYPTISGRHARIYYSSGTAVLEDLDSMNGTAIGRPDQRIKRRVITPQDTIFFGSLRVPATRLLKGDLSRGEAPRKNVHLSGSTMVVGRGPDCDVVLDYPMVSARHATLRRSGEHWTLTDLGSTNGTFLNGGRVTGSARVDVGDVIGLGSYTLKLAGADRLEQRDHRGNLTIGAEDISVDVPGKRLIEGVSLTIYPSELVGLMGPSGAGKTTLMNVLNGYVRPSTGQVLFNALDLRSNYSQFRQSIGYVPQDDIMHRDLTVRQALYFNARLRLPTELTDAEVHQRIDVVLGQLQLDGIADDRIGSPVRRGISGGQRKRVNVAMELLTDPLVLFLDEPTSGLSSEDAVMVMELLRELADKGKTILLTIHQPSLEVFRMMDHLVLLAKDSAKDSVAPAKLAYFGPTHPEAAHFLKPDDPNPEPPPENVLRGLANMTSEAAAARYAASKYKSLYVDQRRGTGVSQEPMARRAGHRRVGLSQWWTLVRRGFHLKVQDTWNSVILLAQAPIIALLIALVFDKEIGGGGPQMLQAAATVLFLMVISALWFGCSNSAREIVGEWAIYTRERMVNLKLPSYVGSKLAILGSLCVAQCAVMLGIVYVICDLHGPWYTMLGLLILTSWIGVALGLLLSAVAKTSEVAISLVPLILLPLVILGGMMLPPDKMHAPMKAVTDVMVSRWAFEGILILDSEESVTTPGPEAGEASGAVPHGRDMTALFFGGGTGENHSDIEQVWGVLGAMFVILILSITLVLRRRDIH